MLVQEKRFLLITSFLLILIGAPAVWSVVREPMVAGTAVALKDEAADGFSARAPASVSSSAPKAMATAIVVKNRKAIYSKSVVLNYDCKQVQSTEVDGNLLRLKGMDDSCLNESWKDISITNNSNGFTASVIFLKKGFTTDFIDLKEGENQLEIHAKDEHGLAVTKKITVKRRAIASVEP